MGDLVPQNIKNRFLITAREAHTRNQERVQSLDSKIRSLYTVASGLVNDGVETLREFGKVQTALDVHQQSILRKSGPFIKPTSSKAAISKPDEDKLISCAKSLANNAAKKRRSRGRGRKFQGLSPPVTPPPVLAPSATSILVPAAQPAVFGSTDARPQYRQAALRGLQHFQSGSGDHPTFPAREKQRILPPSTLVMVIVTFSTESRATWYGPRLSYWLSQPTLSWMSLSGSISH